MLLASDGLVGLAAAEVASIDLALVDIFMPNVEGLEVVRHLRERRPELPVVVMSGSDGTRSPVFTDAAPPDYLTMAVALGAARALRKPFMPDELLDAIAACFDDGTERAGPPAVPGALRGTGHG
ncbi:response regulator [Methylobrevis pamukkalensis]|uniref:Alkaline phosphatase synthesis transcriptional regulatory protein PhoP n=1 Tax=Methylobrevis pamukkalensis TaxID=1439726 RepID=A0A1E3H1V0_9HYPH|nr:response regulator [Methylobrevis pamukkalensis]ODN69766.1 Alkaline phosphatase synthesis transcriptional regulatory protein PhoP [Methylobrevis pamukkalensis]